ncbi:MAG TPA: type I restriction endonuclease [Prolixibacteraceae bacterium]|nr:type I restriction endonuclease [Prolixibacteraceae bacterium]
MTTNTKENGFETLIVDYLVTQNNYEQGTNTDYNKDYAIDETRLFRFLQDTQSDKIEALHILDSDLQKGKFLSKLKQELGNSGIVDVLRKGMRYLHLILDFYYVTPSEKNIKAKELYNKNIFSVTRQVRYSKEYPNLALDFIIFINGLPVATFELKNQFTKQDVYDAVHQYKTDRDPKETIFNFKRCAVHFALDDNEIRMCTKLTGKSSWFLPFNQGRNKGAGNPDNPNGIKTDYLWKSILTKPELSYIVENFAQVVSEKDEETGRIIETQIFPRYHQLSVVKELLSQTQSNGAGQRYLIQHSAGSGKSNSIAWLAHQLVVLEKDGKNIFDSIIVVTDRINLDKQIRNTIRNFMQESSTVGWAEKSSILKDLLASGKKIIITTIFKFPEILKDISTENKDKNFAIIIDEAHSSQSGSLSATMNIALSGNISKDDDDLEDKINKIIKDRKMLKNASYYAFTATPKNKTLEMFGVPFEQPDGSIGHRPFHEYTMKQAIEEGFIMDVLKFYTPIVSNYLLSKKIEGDPNFDRKKAKKRLRAFVEGNKYTIEQKSEIMVEHFHNQVISKGKIGGQARAMVVTASIERAINYYYTISKLLEERNSQYKAIVAFSGEKEHKVYGKVTESSINGFPSNSIEKTFKKDPYRFLVVADKFQTGYDEPLLHTMYVDKVLSDIKAVQTLSRLNRAHPLKKDTFVLDFANDVEDIREAFQKYYKTTILSAETDPNRLNDLISLMERHQVYTQYHIDEVVRLLLSNANRDRIDPLIDQCVTNYKNLVEDDQVEFKSSAKAFERSYTFLAAIMPYESPEWEKLSMFLHLLITKLPSPVTEDLSEGILEAIDFDSYKNNILEEQAIKLENEDAEIEPIPVGTISTANEPELDALSNIINEFNVRFGDIQWSDSDKVQKQIADLPTEVAKSEAYQNAMKNSDKTTAKIESDAALMKAVLQSMTSGVELFKQFQDNPSFKKWLQEFVFSSTYSNQQQPMGL